MATILSGRDLPPTLTDLGDGRTARHPRWRAAVGRNALPVVLVLGLGYMVVAPLVRLQALAFHDGGDPYVQAVRTRGIGETIVTTVALGLGSLLIALVIGTSLAWHSTRLPRRLRWLSAVPMLPVVIPPVASIIGWSFLLSPTAGIVNRWLRELPGLRPDGSGIASGPIDIYSRTWIVILTGFMLTSFVYVFVRAGLARLSHDLTESARTSGASPTRAFVQIVLPLIRPSLIYGGAITLLLGLGQFTAPLLLGQKEAVRVVSTEVYRFAGESPTDFGRASALASPLLLAGLAVVIIQRFLIGDSRRFATDISKGVQTGVRPSRWSAAVLAVYGLVAVGLPLFALMVVSLSPFWTGDIAPSQFTLQHFRTLFDNPLVLDSIRNSVLISLMAIVIALPMGYLVAEVLYRRRASRIVRNCLETIITLPLGIPAVVFGAGFLYTYTRPPTVLYGTSWVVVLVYVTIMLPFTTRLQLAARISLGESYEAAARTNGASPFYVHRTIVVPMIRGALAGAGALMFVLLSHEFSASLLVRSPRTQVMGTQLYDFWSGSSFSLVAAMSLVMCAVTVVGIALALWLGGSAKSLETL